MAELICPGRNISSFKDWVVPSNSTSAWSVPNLEECVQHSLLTYVPAVFLFLTAPVLLRDLHQSENARIENCSPITLKIILCVVLCLDTGVLLFHKLYEHVMNESLSVGFYDLIFTGFLYASLALALVLLIACRNRGMVTSGVLFLYWCLLALCGLPEFRYKLSNDTQQLNNPTEFYLYMVYYPLVVIQLVISCFADVPRYRVLDPRECPELRTSFLNQITFHWFTGLAITGNQRSLVMEDLWSLNARDKSSKLVPEFNKNWHANQKRFHSKNNRSRSGKKEPDGEMLLSSYLPNINILKTQRNTSSTESHPSVLFPIFQTYKWTFLSSAFFKLIFDLMQFISPQLLSLLIKFIEDKSQPLWVGTALSLLMFVCALVQSLILHQYFHNMFRLGMNIRSVLTSAVYAKALNLSNAARKNRTVGEIVNLMSVDIQRFQDMTNFVMLFWSSPLQVILSIVFLARLLGWSVVAGLIVLVAMVPLNAYISVIIRNCQVQQMKYKDERLKMMSEILNGMKVLKFYAWEQSMHKMVLNIRKKEIAVLKKLAYLNALTSLTWTCAPFLVAVLTFGVYVTIDPQNNVLTPEITFVALSLFNILRFPLAILAMIISQAIQCAVSNKRLKSFLDEEEMDVTAVERSTSSDDMISIKHGSFAWDLSGDSPFALSDINISIPAGSLVAVVGTVGSGKSSLLNALLGEMDKLSGTVCVNGSVAYVPQQAWIQNLSLRANILFNQSYDPEKYSRALSVCELRPDLETLPAGDMTEIGEKGINLSGGQKQRVSLARAVYAETDIYLLDDPLSAVDAHVGKQLFQNVISSTTGILKNKTRILVTHGLNYLKKCDRIIVVKDGKISETGTYDELMASEGAFSEFLEEYLIEEAKNRGRSVSFGDQEEEVSEVLAELERLDPERKRRVESQISQVVYSSNESLEKVGSPARKSTTGSDIVSNGVTRQRSTSTRSKEPKETDTLLPASEGDKPPEKSKLIEKETVETGKVKWFVYTTYLRAIGYFVSFSFFLIYVFASILGVLSNLWLAQWSDDAKKIQANESGSTETNIRLAIYSGLGMGQAIFVTVASITMALGMLTASKTLHEGILMNILRSPMSFFDVTPIGRILNRFGKMITFLSQLHVRRHACIGML
uniref:Multidrug resistance-associated protein 1-like n=1 Tax=Steinernema glaseri TaxID=37863 RepID=A0A1I7YAB2_9BILA